MNAALLKYHVQLRGKTLAKLADYLNISESTLHRKMRGDSDFFRNEIIRISEFCELSPLDVRKIFFENDIA